MATVPSSLPGGAQQLVDPSPAAVAVTPSDSANLPNGNCRSLFIGTGGNVTLIDAYNNTAVLFKNLADGSILPVRAKQVKSTGTDAQDIVALY